MLNKNMLLVILLGSSLFGTEDFNSTVVSENKIFSSEVMIKNLEPIKVSVMNFPESKETQNVEIKNSGSIKVEVQNDISFKKLEQNKIVSLNETTNSTIIENFSVLGTISSSLQNITISKTQVSVNGVTKDGLKIKMLADDEIEISKDKKLLVENVSYIDSEEMKTLSNSIKTMIEYSKKDLKGKDFKISWNSKNDLIVSIYTVNKMFGTMKSVEVSMNIGKNSKYDSKAILSVKELEEFKAFLDNFDITKIII